MSADILFDRVIIGDSKAVPEFVKKFRRYRAYEPTIKFDGVNYFINVPIVKKRRIVFR
jgi:hypothetical protein